jgi:hypothetical protein
MDSDWRGRRFVVQIGDANHLYRWACCNCNDLAPSSAPGLVLLQALFRSTLCFQKLHLLQHEIFGNIQIECGRVPR